MKLPVIKHLLAFVNENDEDFIVEAIEVLEHLSMLPSLKDDELDIIGELISNMYGALEVHTEVHKGTDQKAALNQFMQRVMGAIDA